MKRVSSPRPSVFRSRIFITLLAYGVAIGVFSYAMGKNDFALLWNIPGMETSEWVYNQLLLPYWQDTMEPSGYEEIWIMDAMTGEQIGTETIPVYDFPVKNVWDLYIPFSILTWGALGFGIALLRKKLASSKKLQS